MTRDLAASVRGRLLRQAKESGRPLQELLQYFAMERFLFRLSRSEHADRFVLKGALMFRVWGTPQTRATRDIDLLARADNSVDSMTQIMRSVCEHAVAPDGVIFHGESVQGIAIKEDADYLGVRVTFLATIQNARLPMQIDIGFGDVVNPAAITIAYPTMLDFEPAKLIGYPRETVIAEKFEAMVKLGQLNSRMKDFYDILILSRQFDFDGDSLATAISATFRNRGTTAKASPPAFSNEFVNDPGKQIQWASFIRKSKLSDVPDALADAIREIAGFLNPIAKTIESNEPFAATWSPGSGWIQSQPPTNSE
ncbi:nucleotidyl transferase AbiEii/AbiGii toxin family protein [Rosistilla oblonga]|uniref:Nucleotidyl transferase AbiEii toxin, Type IV TA system n=1 Tax=Rosistilla oblonga TaxID=2527990 RepID=A0A518ITX0_9BACT|nr:nucleotidyl transferase AbiEii/AbiGii toxin family protein [Rosistilla oblonga]QDV56536.1 hypothetical protein Mal33_25280 [Rosistilla oblonga]